MSDLRMTRPTASQSRTSTTQRHSAWSFLKPSFLTKLRRTFGAGDYASSDIRYTETSITKGLILEEAARLGSQLLAPSATPLCLDSHVILQS